MAVTKLCCFYLFIQLYICFKLLNFNVKLLKKTFFFFNVACEEFLQLIKFDLFLIKSCRPLFNYLYLF